MRKLIGITLIITAMMLQSCGFHLRGSTGSLADIGSVYFSSSDRYGSTSKAILRSLKSAKVVLVEKSSAADLVLLIVKDEQTSRVLTYASNGRPHEYELYHGITFNLTTGSGKEILLNERISVHRTYLYDDTNVLGNASEEKTLRKDMLVRLVQNIVRRLQVVRIPDVEKLVQ